MSNKVRKKIIHRKKLELDDSVKHLNIKLVSYAKLWEEKLKEVIEKHNALAAQLEEVKKVQQQAAIFVATELGKAVAHQQVLSREIGGSIDHLDLNVMAVSEILREIFGQLSQVDAVLRKMAGPTNFELTDQEIEQVKVTALEWLKDVTSSAFNTVHEKRVKEFEERREAERKATVETEQASKSKAEAEVAERALLEAESGVQQVATGGPGSPIPEGADVFGG